jgi:hypothetical protein
MNGTERNKRDERASGSPQPHYLYSLEMEEETEKLRYGYRPHSVVRFLFDRYYDSII